MRSFFIFLFAVFCLKSSAQPYFDIAGGSFTNSCPKRADQSKFSLLNAFFNIPIKTDSNLIILSPSYEKVAIAKESFDEQCTSFRMNIARLWKLKKNWQVIGILSARSNSSAYSFSSNTHQFGGTIIGAKKVSDRFRYSFGLYYNREFFGNFFVPLAGVRYTFNSRLQLYGLLPNNMNLEYSLNNSLRGGITFSFITTSYRLEKAAFVRLVENECRFYLQLISFRHQVFSLEAGHSVFRNFKTGIGYSSKGISDLNVSDSFLYKISYAFRFYE